MLSLNLYNGCLSRNLLYIRKKLKLMLIRILISVGSLWKIIGVFMSSCTLRLEIRNFHFHLFLIFWGRNILIRILSIRLWDILLMLWFHLLSISFLDLLISPSLYKCQIKIKMLKRWALWKFYLNLSLISLFNIVTMSLFFNFLKQQS